MIKGLIKRILRASGVGIYMRRDRYDQDGLFTLHSAAFRQKPKYIAARQRALKTVTKAPEHDWRMHIALWVATVSSRLRGDFVECGVFVGYMSSAVMNYLDWDKTGKTFYLIDTFKGPEVEQFSESERRLGRVEEVGEIWKSGGYDYNLESVTKNFSEWKNVQLIPGLVPDVLPNCPAHEVAYLHLDMNASLPETEALRFFWPRIVPGGIVLFDDYAFVGYEAQRIALDAVASDFGVEIASLPTGQGLLIKPPQ